MSRILLHTLVFPPDGVSTATILAELTEDLQSKGNTIVVLTTRPHYNRDRDAEMKQPLQRRLRGLYFVSDYCGMRVIHTWMPRKGQGTGGRMQDYMIFHILSLIVGTLLVGRCDIVIAPSPPLSIGIIAWLFAVLKGGRFVYNIQELYPALALQMGLTTTESIFYKVMTWMEHFVYGRAASITTISEGFRQHVINLGIDENKIWVIPNFVDTDFIKPLPKINPVSVEHNLTEKFVVQYAGNIGMTQSFDIILEVAGRLRDEPQIHFLITGDGARRIYVEEQIRQRGLENITLLPYQPRSQVPNIYASADLSLVPLMRGTSQTTIPSKIFTIMASGRPVLVAVDEDSELATIVKTARCGLVIQPDDADTMEAAIRQVFSTPSEFKAYGENGRRFVEAHYSRDKVSQQYQNLIEHLTRTNSIKG